MMDDGSITARKGPPKAGTARTPGRQPVLSMTQAGAIL
jgi:hypothetical protein